MPIHYRALTHEIYITGMKWNKENGEMGREHTSDVEVCRTPNDSLETVPAHAAAADGAHGRESQTLAAQSLRARPGDEARVQVAALAVAAVGGVGVRLEDDEGRVVILLSGQRDGVGVGGWRGTGEGCGQEDCEGRGGEHGGRWYGVMMCD